jgi:S-DNA-T family DNA segregation ATPase FtsK/SpoIIIE
MMIGRKWREILGVVGLFIMAFTVLSLVSHVPTDPPNSSVTDVQNWAGEFGAHLSHFLYLYFGQISWLIVGLGTVVSLRLFTEDLPSLHWQPYTGWILVLVGGCGGLSLIETETGGLVGLYVVERFSPVFGMAGTVLLSLFFLTLGLVMQTNQPVSRVLPGLFAFLSKQLREVSSLFGPVRAYFNDLVAWFRQGSEESDTSINRVQQSPATATASGSGSGGTATVEQTSATEETSESEDGEDESPVSDSETGEEDDDESGDSPEETDEDETVVPFDKEDRETDVDSSPEPTESDEQAADQSEPIEVESRRPTVEEADMSKYKLPSLDLLSGSNIENATPDDETLQEMTEKLEATFDDFDIDASVSAVSPGPVVTTYEVEPGPGVSVNKIESRLDDIKLALAVKSVRIVSPIPGKSAMGIEVPNPDRALVKLRDVMDSDKFKELDADLPIALGMDVMGNPMGIDLAELPHLLVAGATGSGKSVCINSIICSFLYRLRPDQLKLIMVDPKRVELKLYEGLPHLMTPVIDQASDANQALQWAVDEMEERYDKLEQAGCRDIGSYNEQVDGDPLPYVVVVVDELADLMMTSGKECEQAITRIAQKARAVGIHMVLATQRPDKDVITGLIKANIAGRIAFSVSDNVNSRVILDQKGAETLMGNGDMLYLSQSSPNPIRAQGSFINDEETKELIRFVKEQVRPSYIDDEEIYGSDDADGYLEDFDDEYYEDAKKLVVESGKASASMIQRRFSVGYNRAAKMVDAMEQEGIVGPHRGSKAREVLVDADEYFSGE